MKDKIILRIFILFIYFFIFLLVNFHSDAFPGVICG